jgi:hypothetical protein
MTTRVDDEAIAIYAVTARVARGVERMYVVTSRIIFVSIRLVSMSMRIV